MFNFLKRLFKPAVFEIRIKNGKAELTRGKASKAFINDCVEICAQEKLESVTIYGVKCEYGIRLEFSDKTPDSCHQKFRNIWEIHK